MRAPALFTLHGRSALTGGGTVAIKLCVEPDETRRADLRGPSRAETPIAEAVIPSVARLADEVILDWMRRFRADLNLE